MIDLERCNCLGWLTAMIAEAQRHALTAEGGKQKALDEITHYLNNVAAIIDRHGLADVLTGSVPVAEKVAEPAVQVQPDPDLTPEPKTVRLKRPNTKDVVAQALKDSRDGETLIDLMGTTGYKSHTVAYALQNLQREGTVDQDWNRPARYWLVEEE